MAASDLVYADPLPRIVAWLGAHPVVTAALGGAGRVGADNRPPYPRVRVIDPPGGDDRGLRWHIARYVQVEVYGDLDGAPGKAALRDITYTVLGALAELPDQPVPPEGPVITSVESAQAAGWSPEPTGQPRYVAGVLVGAHPLPTALPG